MKAKGVGEVGEVEGGAEEAGKIGANGEGSHKIVAGAGAGGAAEVWTVA